jgi:hypothetical protein
MAASFMPDLSKHPQLSDHPATPMLTMMLLADRPPGEIRKFIEGFS